MKDKNLSALVDFDFLVSVKDAPRSYWKLIDSLIFVRTSRRVFFFMTREEVTA